MAGLDVPATTEFYIVIEEGWGKDFLSLAKNSPLSWRFIARATSIMPLS